jgi:acetylornithine deacetylase
MKQTKAAMKCPEPDLFDLVKTLINIPSVTGSEGALADFLSDMFKNRGFLVQEQKIDGRRRNILACLGSKPSLLLCTHLDTVAPFFPAYEDDQAIYGRGACDAKGSLGAMIWACQELKGLQQEGFGLLLLSGEETDSIGAKTANLLGVRPDFIIVGEPTENKMGSGHKGIVVIRISAKGKRAHSAYPKQGESAIEKLLDVLYRIRDMDLEKGLDREKSVINIGWIEGGVASNVIADSASAEISIRSFLPSGHILERMQKVVQPLAEMIVISRSEPQKLFTVPGFDQVLLPYGSDVPYLSHFGKPILIGPGSGLNAHTENEKVDKKQLLEAAEIYKKLVIRLLAESKTNGPKSQRAG